MTRIRRPDLRAQVLAEWQAAKLRHPDSQPSGTAIADHLGITDRRMRTYVFSVCYQANNGTARLTPGAPAKTKVPPPTAGLLEDYVRQVVDQAVATVQNDVQRRLDAFQRTMREELDALLSMVADGRPRVEPVAGNGTHAAAPGRPAGPSPLPELLSRLPGWVALPPAVKDFDNVPRLQAKLLRLFQRISSYRPEEWPRRATKMDLGGHASQTFSGHGTVWAFRAGKKVRVIVARNGVTRTVCAIVARSDHRYYSSEK